MEGDDASMLRMEGDDASMLSPAAELETQGMKVEGRMEGDDQLPLRVQDFLQLLPFHFRRGSVLLNLLDLRSEVSDFFPNVRHRIATDGRRGQVRLRVLEAIGSCFSSYEGLDVGDICGRNISRLTASEWEVVLRGFRSSSVLREMKISQLKWSSEADLESLGLQLGIILNTSSVTDLTIQYCTLTERFFLNLASGPLENSHSKLKSLQVGGVWGDGVNAMKFILEVLTGHHQLETLSLSSILGGQGGVEAAVRLLPQGLKQNSCLKELVLQKVEGGSAALLLNALAGDDGNRSIERLQLAYMSGIGKCLAEVFISNRSLRVVTLEDIDMPVEECRLLGEAIRDNDTATTVKVISTLTLELEELSRAASSHRKEPVLHLELIFCHYNQVTSGLNLLGSLLGGEIKSVKYFRLLDIYSKDIMKVILSMNGSTGEFSVLSKLQLDSEREDVFSGIWNQLLRVRENTSVTSLSLDLDEQNEEFKDRGFEKEFRDIMALLRVNLTLREIDVSNTPWASDGRAALIEAALKQNRERAVYMSVFTEAKLPLGDAKAGRLFLCGSPKAGKTQLRRTLMKIIHDPTWISELLTKLSRSKGIEVDFLQNDDEMQISIWDLAGHWIFRTLQDVLFPKTNDFCVFLFVYSPVVKKTSSLQKTSSLHKKYSVKPPDCFQTELEVWLTFISSSTKVMGHNLPQVLVVISHKDMMGSNSLDWVHSIVEKLKIRFAHRVNLIHDFLYVNARERNQVKPLKDRIFEMFKKLFSENSPRVPQLCFQLSSQLLSNIKKDKTCPLWSLKTFSEFCDSSLKQLTLPSSVDHSRLLTSLISYLNDVGSIIYIPKLDYIIVDPNWLTNSVLGELIAIGQNFQAQESKAYKKTMPYNSFARKEGFMSEADFSLLIDTFLEKHPRLQDVDRKVLENIIFNLDLGYKLEDSFEYFIPSFIPEYASMEEQEQQEEARVVSMSWNSTAVNPKFVGIRIQCEDQKTMTLSAAFFPRFQMFMRRKLESGTVTLSRHYLQLLLDGHQIYVEHFESEKCHNYVDVLILCSEEENKSKEEAIRYVLKHVVQELISFCASSEGCPGVALVRGVIQTVCVEKLHRSHLRGTILIEELKSKFSTSINDKLEDESQPVKEEELLHYEYTWPEIPKLHLKPTSERVTNLLWKRDVDEVVNGILQKRNQQLKSLQDSRNRLDNYLAQSHTDSESAVSNSSLPHRKDCNPASASCLSKASTSADTQLLLSEIHSVHETIKSMKGIVEGLDVKLGQVISLQQQLQSTFCDLMSKVDRMIGYSESHQQARTPKRPYITDDVGIFYKMSAFLHAGTIVTLHLMCENVTGFHAVKDQKGLKLRLNKENSGWIPRIIEISYKVLYYVVKAGLSSTLGLGDAIPQWNDLLTDIAKLDDISQPDGRAIRKGVRSEELNEAWLRIQETLARRLKDDYSKIFKLYPVKYVRQQNGGHAWVCEECMTKGLRSGSLTC
ncbi:hypothetical protein MPTK2_3g01070 [Marchantia polymorpha subsp. ruderalis]